MAKQLPAVHGASHLPWGEDPITGMSLIKEITSDDGSITVTDPFGPIVDLSAALQSRALVEFLDASVTLSAGGSGTMTFSHASGATIMDLVTPGVTRPSIDVGGHFDVYGKLVTDENVSAGRGVRLDISILGTPTNSRSGGSFTADSATANFAVIGVAFSGLMFGALAGGGDQWEFTCFNDDSVTHTFRITNLRVTFIP